MFTTLTSMHNNNACAQDVSKINRDTPGALAGGRAEQRRPTAAHGTHITLLFINHVLILIKMVVC